MPVVDLGLARLQGLLGAGGNRVTKKRIIETLPFLGLDIESGSAADGTVRVEYSPNRPDYSTEYGIAMGLEGLLGIATGPVDAVNTGKGAGRGRGGKQGGGGRRGGKQGETPRRIRADLSVLRVRPCITGVCAIGAAPGTRVDDNLIKQLMTMQEDLHMGIGRGRKKSSVGIHDLDALSFPLRYTTATRNHMLTPLHESAPMTVRRILSDTDTGKMYGPLLGSGEVPVLLDSEGGTVSLPPVINSASTAVTTKTRNLFVEVTGMDRGDVEDALSVVAVTLQRAGFALREVGISGASNRAPSFAGKRMTVDPDLVRRSLGLDMSLKTIMTCIRRSRIAATPAPRGRIACVIPRYRFDVLGPMDIVEEAALGYGVENLQPQIPPTQTVGGAGAQTRGLRTVDDMMTGLGYAEALNSCLTDGGPPYDGNGNTSGRPAGNQMSVLDSKSREHTVLRDSLLPGLASNLSGNIHHSYPQRLYETGTVFAGERNSGISERVGLAAVTAHKTADFSEIKSVLLAVLDAGFGTRASTVRPATSANRMFEEGRSAEVVVASSSATSAAAGGGAQGASGHVGKGRIVGMVGQLNSSVLKHLKIRVPVAGFEVDLTGLIFD